MGALWRSHGVSLIYEPDARALHNRAPPEYGVETIDGQIYTNLFDTLIAKRNLARAALYEFLGFAANLKRFAKNRVTLKHFLAAWFRGHAYLRRDWRYLNSLTKKQLPSYSHWKKQFAVAETNAPVQNGATRRSERVET